MVSPPKKSRTMFGCARLRVKDAGINSFRVLDNLSRNRFYFFPRRGDS
jgi:hypothetical protein